MYPDYVTVDEIQRNVEGEEMPLMLRLVRLVYPDNRPYEYGYCFVFNYADRRQIPKGQTVIPELDDIEALLKEARKRGWDKRIKILREEHNV